MVTGSRLRQSLDLFLVMVAALLAGALVLVEPGLVAQVLGGVRAGLGLALVTVLPGYALAAALFPQGSLGRWGTLTYSLGLSLVLGTLGGFALNIFPSGLKPGPWAVLLGAVTLLASGLALKRRRNMIKNGFQVLPPSLKIGLRQGILLALAGFLALSAIQLAVTGAIQQPSPGFTQFWMLPTEGGETETPTMRLGLRSFEAAEERYIVEIKAGDDVVRSLPCQLAPGEHVEVIFALPPVPAEGDERAKVEAILYRLENQEQPYRHLIWWR